VGLGSDTRKNKPPGWAPVLEPGGGLCPGKDRNDREGEVCRPKKLPGAVLCGFVSGEKRYYCLSEQAERVTSLLLRKWGHRWALAPRMRETKKKKNRSDRVGVSKSTMATRRKLVQPRSAGNTVTPARRGRRWFVDKREALICEEKRKRKKAGKLPASIQTGKNLGQRRAGKKKQTTASRGGDGGLSDLGSPLR